MTITFGSLFAGIGGLDIGLERAGMRCDWQVENDKYALQVLQKHWPAVPKYRDVRYFLGSKRWRRAREAWGVDLICGGFPCQDISNAGRRVGITGKRSGLWSEFARVVRLLRPKYVLVENVPALTVRGLDRVLGDLASLGFDAEWDRIPACAVGAPHLRWRIFILAYAKSLGREQRFCQRQPGRLARSISPAISDPDFQGLEVGVGERGDSGKEQQAVERNCGGDVSDSAGRWAGQLRRQQFAAYCQSQRNLYWPNAEHPVCGVADGVPHRVDRLRCLGNAVVPQVVEWIGRRIVAYEESHRVAA